MNFIDPRVLNGDTPSSMHISLDKTKTRAETQITAAITIDPLPDHFHTNRFPRPNLVRCKQQATDDEVATHEKNNSATRLDFSLVLATAVLSPEDRERAYRRARGDEPTPRRARGVPIAELDKAAPEHPQNGGAVVICDGCKDRESKRYGRKKKRNAEEEDEWNQYEDERIIMINEKEFKQWKEPSLPHKGQGLSAQAKMVEFPLRITCYCRHQEEKPQDDSALYGYRVIFTLKDTAGKLIAQSMSDVIQITDDHKNRETATQQTLVTPTSQQSMAMNQDFYAFHSQPTTPGAFSQPTTPSVPQPVGMFFSSDEPYAQMSGADSAFSRSISTSNLPNMAARSQFFSMPSRKHHNGVHTPNASASDLTAREAPYTQMPSNVITPYSSTSDLTATDSWCTPVPSNDTFTTSTSMSDDASYNTLSSNGMSSAADFGNIPSWPTSVSGSYDATTGPLTDELTASMSNEAFAIGISPTSSNSDGELTPSFSNSDLSNADVAAMMADSMAYGMSPANSPNEAILGHSHSTSDLAFMGSESMAFGASPTNAPFRGARYPSHQRGQSYNAVRTMNPNAMHTMNGNGMPTMNAKAMHMKSNAMPTMSSGPMQSMNSSVMHPLNTNFNSYAYNRSQSYDSLSQALHQMGCQSQPMNPQVFASQPPSRAASRPASPTWEQGGRSLKKRRSNSAFMLYDEGY